jgi:hypothetical protein
MITAMLIASGRAKGARVKETSFRQYTTSSPIIVKGKTSARYFKNFGISFFSGIRRNGRALVKTVPRTTNPKNIINWGVV